MPIIAAILAGIMRVLPVVLAIGPLLAKMLPFLRGIAGALGGFLSLSGLGLLLRFEPVIELVYQLFTGKQGPVCALLTGVGRNIIGYISSHFLHVDLQSMIDGIPVNIMEFGCYLGLNASLKLLTDGLVAFVVMSITMAGSILVIKVNYSLVSRILKGGRR